MNGLEDGRFALQDGLQYLQGFDVLLLSETRTVDVPDSMFPDHSIAFTPASRQGIAGEGLLVAVKKSSAYHVQDWSSDSTSLWVKLTFHDDRAPLILGVCYLPPAGSHKLHNEDLQSRLSVLTAHVAAAQAEGAVFLGGDFNARVGNLQEPACARQRGWTDGTANAHGKHFLRFCQVTDTLLCTGRAPGDETAPFSYRAKQNSAGSRLDHVLVSSDLYSSLSYSRVNSVREESDHFPIDSALALQVSPVVLQKCVGRSLPKCHWNPESQGQYYEMLQNSECQSKLQAAEAAANSGEVGAAFTFLQDGLQLAADYSGMPTKVPGKLSHKRVHQPFFDAECAILKRAVRRERDLDFKKTLERRYHSVVRAKRRAYKLARLRTVLCEEQSQPRRFWKSLRAARSDLPASLQHVQQWDTFLDRVADCGSPADVHLPAGAFPQQPMEPAASLNDPITAGEVRQRLDRLHNGRAKGMRGLPAELLRYAKVACEPGVVPPENVLVPVLTKVLNAAFANGTVPPAANVGLVTPVFKKGDPLDTDNYRPITVTEPILRLYAGILNARLLQYTELYNLRAETQTGFRPGLSTLHPVFALQTFVDDAFANKAPLYACFLDLKGAYDRVHRPLLWQVLQTLGIHGSMLTALQSMYRDGSLCMHVAGRCGPSVTSHTGVKQGCPLSPTLFGLFVDGLHRFLQARCPHEGPRLFDGTHVADLGYADDFTLLATTARGLQHLIDAVAEFCPAMGLVVSVPKTKVLVFSQVPVTPFQWTCHGAVLEEVSEYKYLGVLFAATCGLHNTFGLLSRKMWAAWALLKRQYGRLQCLSSMGLLFRLYKACVPPTGSYGCEVWSPYQLSGEAAAARRALDKIHLQILRELSGVRGTVSIPILLRELDISPLQDTWWIRTIRFWNSLSVLPDTHLYKRIALHACRTAVTGNVRNWAFHIFKGVRRLGYDLIIRIDALTVIDPSTFSQLLSQRQAAVWKDLDFCPRTCPSAKARLCTYAAWFARPPGQLYRSLLNLPLSMRCLHRLFRFRMGCHSLPRDIGSWTGVPREDRLCPLCDTSSLGDEKHLVFECPALQAVRDKYARLFHAVTTMRLFVWQDDLVGVAKFLDECLEIVYTAGPLQGGQASNQP